MVFSINATMVFSISGLRQSADSSRRQTAATINALPMLYSSRISPTITASARLLTGI